MLVANGISRVKIRVLEMKVMGWLIGVCLHALPRVGLNVGENIKLVFY